MLTAPSEKQEWSCSNGQRTRGGEWRSEIKSKTEEYQHLEASGVRGKGQERTSEDKILTWTKGSEGKQNQEEVMTQKLRDTESNQQSMLGK